MDGLARFPAGLRLTLLCSSLIVAAAVALAACGASTAAPSGPTGHAASTPGHFQVGQTVHGPHRIDLKVVSVVFAPPGNYLYFPLPGGGRWVSVQMTMHNGGSKPYATGDQTTQSMALDFQVHDARGGSIGPSGTQHDPQISGPILPSETASGWMTFAVPASGALWLVWLPAGAEVQLSG
jgi:hypothetical protein